MLEKYGHAVRGEGCPPLSRMAGGEVAFETGLGGEVRLSAIWIPSNCSSGFSLSPSPNLYFLSGRPIFHRPVNSAASSALQSGEGPGVRFLYEGRDGFLMWLP